MWCPSCNELYDDVITKEHAVPFSYEHVTAFIARHLDRIRFVKRIDKRVAIHHHTGHSQVELDGRNVRSILRAIPGVDLIELEAAAAPGRHCNPRWIGRMGRPPWQRMIAGWLEAAQAARVDVVATVYHSCQREICGEEVNHPLAIVNYMTLLGEAIGIEHRDAYKACKLRADPDAIFDEVQVYVRANRLDPERVRAVLRNTFAPECGFDGSNPA